MVIQCIDKATIIFLACVALLQQAQSMSVTIPHTANATENKCSYSSEAVRSGFDKFLQEVQDSYFKMHPEDLIYSDVALKYFKDNFKAYDPSPLAIKTVTDNATALLYKLNNKNINVNKLKPREKKAFFQVKLFLKHNFAVPYDGDYYSGDFLLGPNQFCWQPICYMNSQIEYSLQYFRPRKPKGVTKVIDKMAEFKRTFVQYRENLKYGVKAGMVRSVEECKAGLDAIKRTFFKIALNGPKGVFEEPALQPVLSDRFLEKLEKKDRESQKKKLRKSVLKFIGKPIHKLFRYLEFKHSQHCVPSNISSGLASLPLPFVYINGTNTGQATTRTLPTGEPLDGKKAYVKIMSYFTNTDMTPDEVQYLGYKMLNELYPQVLEIARNVTGQSDNKLAREQFILRLNQSDMYFVNEPIPKNESDKNAHNLCSNRADAKKYCPKRWAAMQRWFSEAEKTMKLLEPKTKHMFHFDGYKQTTPNCPVTLEPDFNPSSGAQSYLQSDLNCTRPAIYKIPFFTSRPGPRYEEWSINAHEARPGHHTQGQGAVEHFQDRCGGVIGWLDQWSSSIAFAEGWGLYAENPLIAKDTDTYKNQPFYKYGMLKWQVWRALRLIVDTGLHYNCFSRQRALDYFAKYAWDTSDGAQKEVTRYQSNPGQATAYMVGQLHIISLRDYARQKLKDKFSLKDFHFYLLSQGSAPLGYLKDSIYKYVECTLNEGKGEGCQDVLYPIAKKPVTTTLRHGIVNDLGLPYNPPRRPLPKRYS